MDTRELKGRLLDGFRSADYRAPMLPAVALELLALTRKPDVNLADVVRLLGHDPMLAGEVLKVANSAAYARGGPLRSIEEAVVRVGLVRVTDLFLQVSLEAKVFRAPGYAEPLNALRRHCVFTAEAARLVSQRTSGLNDYAFLCGLLHDVGIAACLHVISGPLKDLAPNGFDAVWPEVKEVHAARCGPK
jgi:HD-like signal output (HDOD) protein